MSLQVASRCVRFVSVSLLVLLSACTTVPTHSFNVKDADARMVEGCQYLGHYVGNSGWGGAASGLGQRNAQDSVREKAAAAGATDVVWGDVHSGWGSSANGDAYRCR